MAKKISWGKRCANPFRKNKFCTGRGLRRVTRTQRSTFPQLTKNERRYCLCRKEFNQVFLQMPANESSIEESAVGVEEDFVCR